MWQGEELLARDEATPAAGKLWTVKPAGRTLLKYNARKSRKGERSEDRSPGGLNKDNKSSS